MSEKRRATTLDWFRNTLSSRLDNKRDDAIIVVMQRLHVDDLAGHLIEAGGWTHLNLPAIALQDEKIPIGEGEFHHRSVGEALHPEREPFDKLEDQKSIMGSFHFSAQYQQAPVPEEGNLIRPGWFEIYAATPTRETGISRVVQSWISP